MRANSSKTALVIRLTGESAVTAINLTQILQLLQGLCCPVAVEDLSQKPVGFDQAVPAGYAFAAGLVDGNLQQGAVEDQGTHSRRIGIEPGAELSKDHVDSLIHISFSGKLFHVRLLWEAEPADGL